MVNVASAGQAPIDFDDPMILHGWSGDRAYCQSKLAQIMHAFDLAESRAHAQAYAPAARARLRESLLGGEVSAEPPL